MSLLNELEPKNDIAAKTTRLSVRGENRRAQRRKSDVKSRVLKETSRRFHDVNAKWAAENNELNMSAVRQKLTELEQKNSQNESVREPREHENGKNEKTM